MPTPPSGHSLDVTGSPFYDGAAVSTVVQPVLRAGNLLVYWLLFGIFALAALSESAVDAAKRSSLGLVIAGVLLAAVTGLRFEVGGDWASYDRIFSYGRYASLGQMIDHGDPAYQLLNWSLARVTNSIWLVNLTCGAIFSWGLVRFARTQERPWTVVLVAIPYLVIVVAMGYTRQAVAIGILLGGLAGLVRGASIPKFALYVLVAALFHKSAVVVLLLVLVSARRNLFLNMLYVMAAGAVLYDSLLAPSVALLVRVYVDASYNSQGALIRVAMSVGPAALFLATRKRFAFAPDEDILWRNFAYAAFILAILLAVLPSSTVVDRLALYVLPLQLAIVARIPGRLIAERWGRLMVILYAFGIQFVWLHYAAHANLWVPYRNYIWS